MNGGKYMYHIAICNDDKKLNTFLISKIQKELANSNITCTIKCYKKILHFYKEHLHKPFDLLIIHTDFNNGNGIKDCLFLRQFHFYENIIILSNTYLKQKDSFPIFPLCYLTTPINVKLLIECLLYNYQSINRVQTLSFHKKKEIIQISLANILYVESNKTNIYMHTKQEVISFRYKIQDLELILVYPFIRCHQSFIVNMYYITSMQRYSLQINHSISIPISKKYSQAVRKKYQEYLDTFSLSL